MNARTTTIFILASLFLASCAQKEDSPIPPSITADKPQIQNFDSSTKHPVDYFREHSDTATILAAWCRQHLKGPPAAQDPQGAILVHNCQAASFAEFSPTKSVKQGKTYQHYN